MLAAPCTSSMEAHQCFRSSPAASFSVGPRLAQRPQRGTLQVRSALSRKRKEETVSTLVERMESSTVVFGMRMKGIDVKTIQQFRKDMPCDVLVCKNTLMRIACDRVEGWSELKQATLGDNLWVFVKEDQISEGVKAYLDFEAKLTKAMPKDARDKGLKPTEVSGAVMDGKYLTPAEFKNLEKLPTKQELIATVARLIKQVPTKVAVSVKQVPTKLAYGVKAMADADDNKEALVADVCKPKPAEA